MTHLPPGRREHPAVTRFPAVRMAILAKRPFPVNLFWTIVSVLVPTALRWLIDRGAAGVPFVTYYPAVVLAALFLGWRWAAATALFSAIVGNRLFRPGFTVLDFGRADFIMAGLFVLSCFVLINIGEIMRRLLQDVEAAREREAMLSAELGHRVKNLLAVVQSMASLTHRSSGQARFLDDFSARIGALARATDVAHAREASAREVGALVETAVAPFRDGANIRLSGPKAQLPNASCIPLALILHELCTNAVKYGALSVAGGAVNIRWAVEGDGGVTLHWKEEGGPPVVEPARRGMGSALLRAQKGLSSVKHLFPPDGVECVILIATENDGAR